MDNEQYAVRDTVTGSFYQWGDKESLIMWMRDRSLSRYEVYQIADYTQIASLANNMPRGHARKLRKPVDTRRIPHNQKVKPGPKAAYMAPVDRPGSDLVLDLHRTYTITEACAFAGWAPTTLRRWARDGKLAATWDGNTRMWLVTGKAIREFIDSYSQ